MPVTIQWVVTLKVKRTGAVKYVIGQSVTADPAKATRYSTEEAAMRQAERSVKWAGVQDVWPARREVYSS